jgi:hypothetical protein
MGAQHKESPPGLDASSLPSASRRAVALRPITFDGGPLLADCLKVKVANDR